MPARDFMKFLEFIYHTVIYFRYDESEYDKQVVI